MKGSLRHRDFRLFWISLIVSNAGTWLQIVAQDYLVYQLTGRALELGLVDGIRAVALITLPFFGGVVADRVDKKKLLVVTQSLFALAALTLFVLVATHVVRVWHVVALSLFTATVLAFDQPARQSLLPRLVPRSDLPNAIALNAVSYTGAAAIGPAIAGPLVALVGLAGAFLINAVSYLAVITSVWRIRADAGPSHGPAEDVRGSVSSGLRYIASQPLILYFAAMLAILSVLAVPYQTLLPVFNDKSYHGDVTTLGWLRAFTGLGSLMGGVTMAILAHRLRGATTRRAGVVLGAALAYAGLIALFAGQHALVLALGALVLAGFAWTLFQSNVQTLMQHLTDDRMRGRVMSLFAVCVIGAWQLGAFPMGYAADRVGATTAVQASVAIAAVLALGLTFAMRHRLAALETDAATSG